MRRSWTAVCVCQIWASRELLKEDEVGAISQMPRWQLEQQVSFLGKSQHQLIAEASELRRWSDRFQTRLMEVDLELRSLGVAFGAAPVCRLCTVEVELPSRGLGGEIEWPPAVAAAREELDLRSDPSHEGSVSHDEAVLQCSLLLFAGGVQLV